MPSPGFYLGINMPTFRFDKLVRDKIVPILERDGCLVTWRTLSDDAEFAEKLAEKLEEELRELDEACLDENRSIEELADIEEVRDALHDIDTEQTYGEVIYAADREVRVALEELDIDYNNVLETRAVKNRKNGAFISRMFVETVAVPDHSPWIERYLEKGYQLAE
jgi:predicted house-cleaning noncanonical NTP pyrophosphatase (MazG superfamily)